MALDNQQPDPQNVIPDDAPPQPVDVDIEAGTAAEAQEPAAGGKNTPDQDQPARSPLPRPQARIQNLTHERDQWQNTAQRLEAELQQARQQAAQEKIAREQAERSGMENLVQRTKAEVAAAEAAVRAAKDAQDADAEIAASKRLARAVAEEADADAWVAANPRQDPQQQQQRQPQQQPQYQQPEVRAVSGAVSDFMAENPWFSAVQMGSDGRPMTDRAGNLVRNPDFDEDMHDVAMMEDKAIQREIRTGRLPKDYMESAEYFQRITQKVQGTFPDAFESDQQPQQQPRSRTPQMDAPRQPVAPSNRQIPGQTRQSQGEKMRLSGEEADLVRSLVDNGTMIYPRNHTDPGKRGQKMSYNDAYVQYAREKKANPASQQQ